MKHANDNDSSAHSGESPQKSKQSSSSSDVVNHGKKRVTISCSFCDKKIEDVRKMVVSESASICDECVFLCLEIYYYEVGWPTKKPPHPNGIDEMIKIAHLALERKIAEQLLAGNYGLPNKDLVNGAEILETLFGKLLDLAAQDSSKT